MAGQFNEFKKKLEDLKKILEAEVKDENGKKITFVLADTHNDDRNIDFLCFRKTGIWGTEHCFTASFILKRDIIIIHVKELSKKLSKLFLETIRNNKDMFNEIAKTIKVY